VLQLLPIIKVLASFVGTTVNVDVSTRQKQRQQSINRALTERQQTVNRASTERQQSINYLSYCILYNPRAKLWHLPIINILAAFVGKREGDMVTAPVWKWASTERQRFCVLHLVSYKGCATAFIHNRSIGHLLGKIVNVNVTSPDNERQQSVNRASTEHQQSINRASTILGVASCMIQRLCYSI